MHREQGPTTTIPPRPSPAPPPSRSRGYSYGEGRDMANILTLIAERDRRPNTDSSALERWPSGWVEQQPARPPSRTASPRHAPPMRPPSTTPRRSTPAIPVNAPSPSAARPIAPRRSTPALPSAGTPPPQRWVPSSYPSHQSSRPTSPQVRIPSSRPATPQIWIPPTNTATPRATTPQRWIPSPAAFAERTGSPVQRVASPRVVSTSSTSSSQPSPLNPVARNASDEVIARQLAKTWHVESLQGTLLDDPTYAPNAAVYRVQSPPIHAHTRTVSNSGAGSDLLARTLRRNSVSQAPLAVSRPHLHEHEVLVEGGGPDAQLLRYRRLFTTPRPCPQCSTPIDIPRTPISLTSSKCLTDSLHLRCIACGGSFCAGCLSACNCNCADAVALAVFRVLAAFDAEYTRRALAEAEGVPTREMREAFVDLVVARTQPRTLEWEKVVVGALRTLDAVLTPTDSTNLHPAIVPLMQLSTLPEVLASLLRGRSVGDWVALSDTYCAALALLRTMANCGLASVLKEPLRRMGETRGVEAWMWGEGGIVWERAGANGQDAYPEPFRETDDLPGTGFAHAPPIYDLVRGLERHRRPLLELAGRIRFPATVQKIHAMCDGILYLLLQQMVP